MISLRSARSLVPLGAAFFALLLLSQPAQAHFIWLHVLEDERQVEVLFGDGVYQDSDASLMSYVEGLRAWTPDGVAVEFEAHPWGLRGSIPEGVRVIGAARDMGLFARPGRGPAVKLDYDSKGVATLADATLSVDTRGEIFVQPDGDELVVAVVFDGRPAIAAEVLVPHWDSRVEEQRTTNQHGVVRVPRPASGSLALRAKITLDEPGEYEGEPYSSESHYVMLTISDVGSQALPSGTQRQAWLRMDELSRNLEILPKGLEGFGGVLGVAFGAQRLRGEFEFVGGELKELELPDCSEELRATVALHLADMIESRRQRDFASDLGRFPITIDERDAHPLGRRIRIGDEVQTAVRVTADRVLSREWNEGGVRVVERILAYEETPSERLLPTHFVAHRFDSSGALTRSESWVDAFTEVEGVYVPKARTLQVATGDRVESLHLELRNLEFFWAAREAAAQPGRD